MLSARSDASNDKFGAFYARWEAPVLAYFLRRTGAADLAADLASETFAQALASRGSFRAEKGSASSWLFGVAHHVLARSARSGQVEFRARQKMGVAPIVLDDETIAVIEALSAEQTVRHALEMLPPDQREAVHARIMQEDTYEEIADRLSCSPAVVRQRVSRGLASLRSQLGENA